MMSNSTEQPIWTFWIWDDYQSSLRHRPVRCDVTPTEIRFPMRSIPLSVIEVCKIEAPHTIYNEKSWILLEWRGVLPPLGQYLHFSSVDPYRPVHAYNIGSEHAAFVHVVNRLREGHLPTEVPTNPYERTTGLIPGETPAASTHPLKVAPHAERKYWIQAMMFVVLFALILGLVFYFD